MIENIGAYSQVDYDRGYQQGVSKATDILQLMKEDDYHRFIHSNYSMLTEKQWDYVIDKFIEKIGEEE